jgi:hypothetical protein
MEIIAAILQVCLWAAIPMALGFLYVQDADFE